MRLPLASDGLPFTGTKTLIDLRSENSDVQEQTRYVSLWARNLDPDSLNPDTTVVASLITSGSVTLTTASMPADDFTEYQILRRFPVRGAAAVEVVAGATAICYGYIEDLPQELPSPRDVFQPSTPTSPYSAPTGQVGATETLIQTLSEDYVEEVSLTLATSDLGNPIGLLLRFYSTASAYAEFAIPDAALDGSVQLFDRIPMLSAGSIRAIATADDRAIVYGTFVRR